MHIFIFAKGAALRATTLGKIGFFDLLDETSVLRALMHNAFKAHHLTILLFTLSTWLVYPDII